jgi:hypothetical protein
LIVPLLNLESEVPKADLGDGFSLSPFTDTERSDALRLGKSVPMWEELLTPALLRRAQVKLRKTFMLPPGQSPETDEMRESIGYVVGALRLHKRGDVGTWAEFSRAPIEASYAGGYLEEYRVRRGGTTYAFLAADVPAVVALAEGLRDARVKSLAIALRRFNLVYARDLHEDRIIDLSVSLEASLLAGIEEELTYRLAIRGAALLAAVRRPTETHTLLDTLYFARSKIVHEGRDLFDKDTRNPIAKRARRLETFFPGMELHEFSGHCEECVRDVLKAYIGHLRDGKSLGQINSDLDVRVLERLAPSA